MDRMDLGLSERTKFRSEEERIRKIMHKFVIGMYIGKSSGNILYTYQIDPTIDIEMIPQFIAAINIFGQEKIGNIKRIHIEGENLEILVLAKHNLLLTVIFRPQMVQDYLEEEGIRGLTMFYEMFKENLEANHSNLEIFRPFDKVLQRIIIQYLERIHAI